MHRSYNARIAGLTVGSDAKWIDNVLSHYQVVGVEQGTRGIERKLDDRALLALAICRLLSLELGVPLATAVLIANQVVASRVTASGQYHVTAELTLRFSVDEIERRVRSRLADAVESVAHVRRGRPPRGARSE